MYPWLQTTFKQLSIRLASDKLHHGLLIQGPNGLGKAGFALDLAKLLLCQNRQGEKVCEQCQGCQLNASETHPDLHKVESEKQIGVDQIRDAIKQLTGSAQMSGAKVLIIYQADSMTESSANALLKTLEEPTANTYLILTTDKPERILPTILSRCEKLTLPLPNLSTTLGWVKSQHPGEIDINFAQLFAHRPLTLLEELQYEQRFSYDNFITGVRGLISGQENAVKLASDWQEHADKVVKWLQAWVKQGFINNASEQLWHINTLAIGVLKKLKNPGVNKTLVLAELLSELGNIELNQP